jgi:hypothetical protein
MDRLLQQHSLPACLSARSDLVGLRGVAEAKARNGHLSRGEEVDITLTLIDDLTRFASPIALVRYRLARGSVTPHGGQLAATGDKALTGGAGETRHLIQREIPRRDAPAQPAGGR